MGDVFAIIGIIIALILAASCLVASIAYLIECRAKSRWQQDQHLIRNTKRDVGSDLSALCHWFTEDIGAWKAIDVIGRELQRTGDFDVRTCRDRWRQEVEKAGESSKVK